MHTHKNLLILLYCIVILTCCYACAKRKIDMIRLESNNLVGTVPTEVCDVYDETLPVFFSDCTNEVVCPCCLFCCTDGSDECQCQYADSDLDFLCFQRSINIFDYDIFY